jgi:hypothetical protein
VKLKSHWAPYLVATGAITLGSLTTSTLAHASTSRPRLAVPFTIRLEDQFLARLHYLPVTFVPTSSTTTTTTTSTTTTTVPTSTSTSTTTTSTTTPTTTTTTTIPKKSTPTAVQLQSGSFVWRYPALPALLRSQWQVGTSNVVLTGALMNFQNVQGDLATTGTMNSPTWQALVHAVLVNQWDPSSYDYVLVNKNEPEHLSLYQNDKVTFTTLVNTGVEAAPTVNGTYPVYLRFTTTTMSGIEPDGKPYHDTGIPWVSYFHGGDALHGFIRDSYGWPQSLGCVEMPFADAAALWPHTPIGTLVTVE